MSPDNKHVYITSNVDDAVSVFSRNITTGELTYLQAARDGLDGFDGLDGASGILVSPDGLQVYVAADQEDAITILRRDPATGLLTFARTIKSSSGIPKLDGANYIAMNHEGTDVFVTSAFGDAVVVFSRDRANGDLTYVEYQGEGSPGVDGLDSARAVVVSPDGRNVYATGQNDDAVAVFSRDVPYFLVSVAAGGQGSNIIFGNYRTGGNVVPGDTDGNDVVDLADLNNVRNNFGTTGDGDTDGDGDVDLQDLNNVRNNFGLTGTPSPPAPLLADAVFESPAPLAYSTITPRRTAKTWKIAWDEALERVA